MRILFATVALAFAFAVPSLMAAEDIGSEFVLPPGAATATQADSPAAVPLRPAVLANPLRGEEPAAAALEASTAPVARVAERTTASVETPAQKSLSELRSDLTGSDPLQALLAVQQLERRGEAGADVLVETLAAAKRPSSAVIYSTLRALESMGPAAAPALGRSVATEHFDGMLARVLQNLGPQAAPAIPALTEILNNATSTADQKRSAASALAAIGTPARSTAISLLDQFERTSEVDLQSTFLEAVGQLGDVPADRLPGLLACLTDEERPDEVRLAVATILARQPQPSPVLLPSLLGFLHPSRDSEVCRRSAEIAGQLGPAAVEAKPALMGLLVHETTDVRAAAVKALGSIAGSSPDCVGALARAAQSDPDPVVRQSAIASLQQCGPSGVSALLAGITSPDPQVRENTLVALATLGQSAQSAAAPLLQLLSDARQSDWHLAALNVLKAVHPDHAAAEPLVQRVVDRSQPVEMRIAAVMALGEIGPAAAAASPKLAEVLQRPDEDAQLRAAVAVAISRVDTGSLDSLHKALQDAHGLVRIAAAWCLGQRDPRDAEAFSCLVRELGDDEFSGYAEDALVLLGEPVTLPLAAIVHDELGERPARQAAVRVLGRLGATGIPHLVDHLADQDEQVADEVRHTFYNLANTENLPVLIETWQTRSAKLAGRPEDPRGQTIVARLRRIILDVSGEQGGPGGAPAAAADPLVAPSPAVAAPETEPAGGAAPLDQTPPAAAAPPAASQVDDAPRPIAPASPVRAQGAMETPAYKRVKVFYGTNRQPLGSGNRVAVDWQVLLPILGMSSLTMLLCSVGFALARSPIKAVLAALGLVATLSLAYTAAYQPVLSLTPSQESDRSGPQYGTERSNELAVGTCEVSIPATHQYGELEAPSVFKLEFRQDPNRHIMVQSVRATSRDIFYAELQSDLAQRGAKVLVFVHGYNVSFDDAARRTAQMAEDLKFAGVPLFFSWPSQGNWYEYRSDEKQVELAIPALREFLTEISRRSGSDSIHLIAHSMGSRALTAALRELAAEAGASTRFKQVVLAAPDIDADVFRERIAPAMAAAAQQVTLYASSNDLALVASRVFNSGDPRAGDSHRLLILPGIETVDVSEVDTSLLGHSYYGDNPTVLTDLRELLLSALPAAQRAGLVPLGSDEQRYWALRRLNTARATESPSATQLPAR